MAMAARAEQHTNHALCTHGGNCTISRNTAEANGGGIIGNAGGVFIGNGSAFVMRGSAKIRDNSFTAKEGSRLATPSGAGGVYMRRRAPRGAFHRCQRHGASESASDDNSRTLALAQKNEMNYNLIEHKYFSIGAQSELIVVVAI